MLRLEFDYDYVTSELEGLYYMYVVKVEKESNIYTLVPDVEEYTKNNKEYISQVGETEVILHEK